MQATIPNNIKFKATIVFEQIWQASQSGLYKLIEEKGSSRSSKTWSNFQVLFLDLYSNPMTVCTILRDTQTSCREIVEEDWIKWLSDPMGRKRQLEKKEITIHEFDQLIESENLLKYFDRNKTKHVWTFKHNKSYIRFTGLDDEDDAMGLTQDICWINEPYKFSHEVYKQLSQRTAKYILFDWNPKKDHWVDKERKKENTITLTSTFKDNPFCPTEMRKQILSYQPVECSEVVLSELIELKEALIYNCNENRLNFNKKQLNELIRCQYNEYTQSASLYHWQVYGLGEKSEKPNRIFSWKEISDTAYNEINAPIYIGNDWGKVDPWAIVECKYQDGALYLKELNYYSENEIRQNLKGQERLLLSKDGFEEDSMDEGLVSWYFERLGISKKNTIVCDSNRPRKIAALRRLGYENAMPASKPKGSIIDGIDLMENLKIYHTSSSKNIAYEQENYSRKIDRYGTILEDPEDKDNHCFIGGTLVQTINGPIPIKEVQVGEIVLTSNGYKKVLHKFNNGKKQVYKYSMQFDTKTVYLCSTETHNIKTEKAWVQIKNLKVGNVLFLHKSLTEDHTSQISTQKLQSVKVVDSWTEEVYDLMIEDTHEYFANGVLVHNCIDSVRYIALYLQKKGIIKLS